MRPGTSSVRPQPPSRRRANACVADRATTADEDDPGPGQVRRWSHDHGSVGVGEPVCVAANAPLRQVKDLLLDRRMPGVPVVDIDRRPIGIVTRTDLLAADGAARDRDADDPVTVADIMTAMVFVLPASASLEQVAALMAYEGIQQVVITDDGGKVVGLVSSLDIARWCAQSAGYLV